MTNPIDLINFVAVSCGLTIIILGFIVNIILPDIDRNIKNFFRMFLGIMILYAGFDLVSQFSLVLLDSRYALLSRIAVYCESLFSSLLPPLMTWLVLYSAGAEGIKKGIHCLIASCWIIYFVMLTSTWFSDAFYFITPDNVYHRGSFYPLLVSMPFVILLVNMAILIIYRKKIPGKLLTALAIYHIFPLICTAIQACIYGLLLTVIGTCISAFFMFIYMIIYHTQNYMTQVIDNYHYEANNLALQMRPHFIYNVLISIYYLIDEDPKKAQNVILNFSNYLRHNFTAISKKELIPFTEELEHVRAYVAVEQARYEDRLFVDYDTDHIAFHLPPLTLQPLVENAVKHGIEPELAPLHITISTRKCESGDCIIVEDTGIGFTEKDNDNPHIALENIRKRLEIMCNGTLTIAPRDGGGTEAKIFIPA